MSEPLPFDVEIERRSIVVDVASALVIIGALAVALKLVPLIVLLPPLVVSAIGRRFGSSAVHLTVEDGALSLGNDEIASEDVRDVWLDDDGVDPRVVIAWNPGHRVAALWFPNREQAARCARALGEDLRPDYVAGHRPRKLDLLAPLRFVAIGAGFFVTGSWYGGLFSLVFFGLGAWAWVAAKQLVVRPASFTLTSAFGEETVKRDEIESVDVDEGIITLQHNRTLTFARIHSRDPHLTTPLWTDSLRRRALKDLAAGVAQKEEGPTETADPSS